MTLVRATMDEIRAVPWNGYKVVSTFSGCGGSCLGYRWAGFRVLWANEFCERAQEVYRLNHPDSFLDTRDVRKISGEEILEQIGLEAGEIDLLDGSPPCSAFSLAGKRHDGWGKEKFYNDKITQRVDDLFFEYARLLKDLKPRMFVAENVPGLVVGKAKGYFKKIMGALKGCGYEVSARILDAQWLGVPQVRKRLIFVGVRSDLGVGPRHPGPFSVRPVIRDVCPWIKSIRFHSNQKQKLIRSDQPAPTVMASGMANFWFVQHTVNLTSGSTRKLELRDLRRFCGFPDEFKLTGTYREQWERLGRAVPPPMSRAIGLAVAETLGEVG